LLSKNTDVDLLPVTRQKIPNWCCVTDYAQSPSGEVLIHLAENCDRGQVANLGTPYEASISTSLAALLAKRYQRIVYVSSAVLYGDAEASPHLPTDRVLISDAYALVKYQSELAILKSPGGIVVRLANVYGHGMSGNNVISTILSQIPGTGVLHVMDAGPIRDFISVDDVAEGIAALALRNNKHGRAGGIYNLGTGIGTSIGALAGMALEIAGQSERRVEAKLEANIQSHLIVDYSKTTRDYGWEPKKSLKKGLAELLQNIKNLHNESTNDSSFYR
jgi:nucleoside-diphosphate-sugar epimerase